MSPRKPESNPALEDNAVVSLSDLKVYLKLTGDSSFDTLLELLIFYVSAAFDKITGRNLVEHTYANQLYDGNDKRRLYLKNYPIQSVSDLEVDGVALEEGAGKDFIIYSDEGYLWRVGGNWAKGNQNIDITYNGGYTSISRMNFDSGSEEPAIGVTLTSASGSGVVTGIRVSSGTWAEGDAAGYVEFASITGEFANNETVDITDGNSNVMTVNEPGGSAEDSPGLPGDLRLAGLMQIAKAWKEQDKSEWGETSRSMPDGSISLTTEDLLPFVAEVLERYKKRTL